MFWIKLNRFNIKLEKIIGQLNIIIIIFSSKI